MIKRTGSYQESGGKNGFARRNCQLRGAKIVGFGSEEFSARKRALGRGKIFAGAVNLND
jgi:hypothetical protein